VLSNICEEFKCTPSQAEKEFIGDILDIYNVRLYARLKRLVDAEDTTEETLARVGFENSHLVEVIFENIERSARDG
jgi:hypothetical protein